MWEGFLVVLWLTVGELLELLVMMLLVRIYHFPPPSTVPPPPLAWCGQPVTVPPPLIPK